jgi:hypothetical protein
MIIFIGDTIDNIANKRMSVITLYYSVSPCTEQLQLILNPSNKDNWSVIKVPFDFDRKITWNGHVKYYLEIKWGGDRDISIKQSDLIGDISDLSFEETEYHLPVDVDFFNPEVHNEEPRIIEVQLGEYLVGSKIK